MRTGANPLAVAYYTCVGPVRGGCGVHHRSLAAAARCCSQDHRHVRRGHGGSAYSDRTVQAVQADGSRRGLSQDEQDHMDAAGS